MQKWKSEVSFKGIPKGTVMNEFELKSKIPVVWRDMCERMTKEEVFEALVNFGFFVPVIGVSA